MKLKLSLQNPTSAEVLEFSLIAIAAAHRRGDAAEELSASLLQVIDDLEFEPAEALQIIDRYNRRKRTGSTSALRKRNP
jgi:hypothetical protein